MNEQNFMTVLDALGEAIEKLKDEVFFKDLQIQELKKKLSEAEKQAEEKINEDC